MASGKRSGAARKSPFSSTSSADFSAHAANFSAPGSVARSAAADALDDGPGAEAAYQAAAAIKGDDAPCLNNLGVAVFNQGRACDAIPHFQAALAAKVRQR